MHALILVDLQNDFLPGGALAVAHGDETVPVANRMIPLFPLVVATQDWHPADHGSFASNHPGRGAFESIVLHGLPQTLWPDHCVQGSRGAEFAPGLRVDPMHRVFRKGGDARVDSYSGLYDNGRRNSTGLGEFLRERGVTDVWVLGLATDYCVKFTVLDALSIGLRVHVIEDGCRAVELAPGDGARALAEMAAAGARIVRSEDVQRLVAGAGTNRSDGPTTPRTAPAGA